MKIYICIYIKDIYVFIFINFIYIYMCDIYIYIVYIIYTHTLRTGYP